jgi:hypothetical protein
MNASSKVRQEFQSPATGDFVDYDFPEVHGWLRIAPEMAADGKEPLSGRGSCQMPWKVENI